MRDGPAHGNEALHGEHDRVESDRARRARVGAAHTAGTLERGGVASSAGVETNVVGRDVPRHGDDDVAVRRCHAVHVVRVNAEADELAGGLSLLLEAPVLSSRMPKTH